MRYKTNQRNKYNYDYLCEETRKLDHDQRSVVDMGVQYAQNVVKSMSNSGKKPLTPLVI